MTGRSLPTSVMAFIKSWQFDSLSKTNTHPYPTCLSQPALVVFYFCLCRLIAYEAINLVLEFSFILCTILICPTQAWEAGPCRQTFSLSCNSPLPPPPPPPHTPPPPPPPPPPYKQRPIPPIKISQHFLKASRAVAHLKDIISTPLKFRDT